jgi:hypothetical protein
LNCSTSCLLTSSRRSSLMVLLHFGQYIAVVICFPDIFMLSPFACSLGLGDLEQVRQFAFHVENLVHMA